MVVAIDRLGRDAAEAAVLAQWMRSTVNRRPPIATTLGVSRATGEVDLLWVGGEKRFVVQIGSEFLDVEGTMKSGT